MLHYRLLCLLLEFDEVCKRHGISYFLDCGTLLGAVRHKGFIPWDDDIDVCMDRRSFRKLMRLYKSGSLNDKFAMRWYHGADHYHKFYMILLDKNGPYYLRGKRKYLVGIDIFILDFYDGPNGRAGSQSYFDTLTRLTIALDVAHIPSYTPKGALIYRIFKECIFDLLKCAPPTIYSLYCLVVHAYLLLFVRRYAHGQFVCAIANYMMSRDAVYSVDEIYPFSQVEFEGYKFSAPRNAHIYLTRMYGDYMTLPDPERRVGHSTPQHI